ncbi:hypothetical protein GP5015_142 [gamma proteobacterium HTCC5015]|nr:hypothetical protein GP5015_142 [gamma proteobacterium HTCC5015]
MDLLDRLLDKGSPYIFALIYDIDERALVIEMLKDPKQADRPFRRAIFPGVTAFREESLLDEPDDENLDDLVDILPLKEGGYIITTFKKALTIHTREEPIVEAA